MGNKSLWFFKINQLATPIEFYRYNGFLIFTLSGRDGNLIFKHRMSTKGPIRDFTFDHSSSPEKLYILDLLEDGRLKIYNATEDGLSRSELEISLEDERKIEDFVASK